MALHFGNIEASKATLAAVEAAAGGETGTTSGPPSLPIPAQDFSAKPSTNDCIATSQAAHTSPTMSTATMAQPGETSGGAKISTQRITTVMVPLQAHQVFSIKITRGPPSSAGEIEGGVG